MKRFLVILSSIAVSLSVVTVLSINQATAASIWVDLTGVPSNEWTAIATSADGSKVVAALKNPDNIYTSKIYSSSDSGATWTDRSGAGSDKWYQVAMSANGSTIIAGGESKFVVSTNSGANWSTISGYTSSVAMSSDGTKMARVSNGIIYLSNDSGQNWARSSVPSNFALVAYSGDGNLLIAATSDGHLFTLTGLTWTERAPVPSNFTNNWSNIITDSTGSTIFVSRYQESTSGDLYKSTDSGATWSKQSNFPGQQMNSGQLTCDATCAKIYANPYYIPDGFNYLGNAWGIWSSLDGGATWTQENVLNPHLYRGFVIAMSSNGKKIYASESTRNDGNRLLTYNADYLPSNNANFTLYVNGSPISDGQTLNLSANRDSVSVEIITADPAHQTSEWFGSTNCGTAGSCLAADVQLDNYVNNISGTDTISIYVTAEDRVTRLTKTITVVQPFTHRTILNYNAGYYGDFVFTNARQQITTGSGLPVTVSRVNAHFINWSDGSIANPRTDPAGKDISVWPNFGLDAETGKVVRNYLANEHGGVDGPGNCPGSCQQITPGQDAVTVTARADDGYDFSRWSDGSTSNPRTDIAVQSSADLVAIFVPHLNITIDSVSHAQVASIPAGVKVVSIPASASLPATSLNFGGSVPTSATVVPVATNPASASATPFMISGSTKIVDIQISGTFTGSATVCLDGASTDHLFHYTGGAWVELPSRTYVNGQVCGVTTSFSPFAAAPPAPVAPVVVYVPPTPVPYLKTLTNPQIHLAGDKFVCSAGTYNSGYTLDGVIQGSATSLYTPSGYTYNLMFNQVTQSTLAVTTNKNSATWELSAAPAGALVSCSVTVSANSLKNTDSSTANPGLVSAALTTQSQSAAAAENAYNAAVSANSKSYQKALVDNRAAWRTNVDKVHSAYLAELSRINGLPATKENRALKSAALKAYLAAQKKTAVDYKASGPIAMAARDLANKTALEAKNAAISKANSAYGAFIESVGYGVLIP